MSAGNKISGPLFEDEEQGMIAAEGAEAMQAEYDEDQEEEEEDENEEAVGDAMMGQDDLEESESASESGTDSLTWISWFCSLPGHEYFAEVSEDFIEDDFNLTGLNALVPFYREALEMILDVEPQEDSPKIPDVSIVESSAELLYGLIHQRYILTRQGLQQMVEKFESGHFGYCPRVFCHSHPVLPCGRSDLPGLDTVKLYCPNCFDCYAPPSSRFHGVDGAFFGTTFPHLLFQCYRDIAPSPIAPPGSNEKSLNPLLPSSHFSAVDESGVGAMGGFPDGRGSDSHMPPHLVGQKVPNERLYTPRIYGFRVSEHAKSGPRMRWLRMRPESYDELMKGLPAGSTNKPATDTLDVSPASIGNGDEALSPRVDVAGTVEKSDAMAISGSGR
ncbi:hypothetical protein K437DRAFT_55450 [Tilletiaria anomala UBC 951]|uniref:Casein kinase II subunit beta n=1 Tax=Tilletiaria anomala (strain ATCC 24038 / CBS 436.72 / UBC 951) TaxID=1037660 RepID=A0A066WBK4_TILAU|nr:uncharacterized protein K437DRAFT_55450 [Tilletiaria anomala UBC 951]KDN51317.1 hypothetical protein K437DRAFT_55450 [Tilletiaria anomala UBC 951]